MINSNFNIGFNIDREKLFEKLILNNYECTYDPIIHACVNLKYTIKSKKISIFIFESGSIIITGANNCNQILCAYNFINKYLLTNYDKIIMKNILSNSTILDYL